MSKLLWLPIIAIITLSSCKKSNPTAIIADSSITATINGVDKSFNIKDAAEIDRTPEMGYYLALSGTNTTADTVLSSIVIAINLKSPISKGKYVMPSGSPNGFFSTYFSLSIGQEYSAYYPIDNGATSNTVTITNINSTRVQGTFDMTVSECCITSKTTNKTITNGKFDVAIK